MNAIAKLFSSKAVLLDVDVADRQALFSAVGNIWQEIHGLSADEVAAGLNAREKLGSTGLGEGIAIPHARIEGLTRSVAAFVRTKQPIEFQVPDGKPVAYYFLLLVPEKATEKHIQILAEVARKLSDTEFRGRLDVCKSQDEVYQLFAA